MTSAVAEVRPRFARARLAVLQGWLEREGLLVLVVAGYAAMLLLFVGRTMYSDGWLALAAGREIAQHGLPTHDSLTLWTLGKDWIDQQWLSQLAIYGLAALIGLKALLIANALLLVSALAASVAMVRRAGASARAVTWILVLALTPFTLGAGTMRPQSLAYLPFVAVLWLIAGDSRRRSSRVLLVFPLLVLWGNLHGSAVLGAALVALHGVVEGVDFFRQGRPSRRLGRAGALIVLPWPCLLASPYWAELPDYYNRMLVDPPFRPYASEWAATTLGPTTLPLFVLAFAAVWLVAKAPARLTSSEKVVLLACLALSFVALRNVVWFALASVCLLPLALDGVLGERQASIVPRLNRLLASLALGVATIALLTAAARSEKSLLPEFRVDAADAVARSVPKGGTIFSSELYADWLLWTHPELSGRVAFDARFELLSARQLEDIQTVRFRIGDWRRISGRFDVVVVDAGRDSLVRALRRQPGTRVAYRDRFVSVIAQSRPVR